MLVLFAVHLEGQFQRYIILMLVDSKYFKQYLILRALNPFNLLQHVFDVLDQLLLRLLLAHLQFQGLAADGHADHEHRL